MRRWPTTVSTCDHNPCTVSGSVINVAYSPPNSRIVRPRAHNAPATPSDYERSTPGDYTRSHLRRIASGAAHNPSYPGIVISVAHHPRQYAGIVRALARNPRGCTSVIARFTTDRKMGTIASNFAYSPTLSRTVSGAVYNAPTSEGLRSSALTIAEVLGLFVDRCTIVALCKTPFACSDAAFGSISG